MHVDAGEQFLLSSELRPLAGDTRLPLVRQTARLHGRSMRHVGNAVQYRENGHIDARFSLALCNYVIDSDDSTSCDRCKTSLDFNTFLSVLIEI